MPENARTVIFTAGNKPGSIITYHWADNAICFPDRSVNDGDEWTVAKAIEQPNRNNPRLHTWKLILGELVSTRTQREQAEREAREAEKLAKQVEAERLKLEKEIAKASRLAKLETICAELQGHQNLTVTFHLECLAVKFETPEEMLYFSYGPDEADNLTAEQILARLDEIREDHAGLYEAAEIARQKGHSVLLYFVGSMEVKAYGETLQAQEFRGLTVAQAADKICTLRTAKTNRDNWFTHWIGCFQACGVTASRDKFNYLRIKPSAEKAGWSFAYHDREEYDPFIGELLAIYRAYATSKIYREKLLASRLRLAREGLSTYVPADDETRLTLFDGQRWSGTSRRVREIAIDERLMAIFDPMLAYEISERDKKVEPRGILYRFDEKKGLLVFYYCWSDVSQPTGSYLRGEFVSYDAGFIGSRPLEYTGGEVILAQFPAEVVQERDLQC